MGLKLELVFKAVQTAFNNKFIKTETNRSFIFYLLSTAKSGSIISKERPTIPGTGVENFEEKKSAAPSSEKTIVFNNLVIMHRFRLKTEYLP